MPEEIEQCYPFLLRRHLTDGPEVIVALGTFAAQALLKTDKPLSYLRGVFHDYHGTPVMPTFRSAYLLGNPGMKQEVWEDMKKDMNRLAKVPPKHGRPRQLD